MYLSQNLQNLVTEWLDIGLRERAEHHHSIPCHIPVVVSSCSPEADEGKTVFCSHLSLSRNMKEVSKVTFMWLIAFQVKSIWKNSTGMVNFKLGANRSSLWEGSGVGRGGVRWVFNGQADRKDIMKAQQWPTTDVIHVHNSCPGSLHNQCKC